MKPSPWDSVAFGGQKAFRQHPRRAEFPPSRGGTSRIRGMDDSRKEVVYAPRASEMPVAEPILKTGLSSAPDVHSSFPRRRESRFEVDPQIQTPFPATAPERIFPLNPGACVDIVFPSGIVDANPSFIKICHKPSTLTEASGPTP